MEKTVCEKIIHKLITNDRVVAQSLEECGLNYTAQISKLRHGNGTGRTKNVEFFIECEKDKGLSFYRLMGSRPKGGAR